MNKFNDVAIRAYAEEHNCSYVDAYKILEKKFVGLPVEDDVKEIKG